MKYSAVHIAKILDAKLLGNPQAEKILEYVVFDTRRVVLPGISFFVALKGKRQDGHHYIAEAYSKGIRTFLISDKTYIFNPNDCTYLVVDECLLALQQLAKHHRKRYNIPVIGITGSNGKTIIKEWLNEMIAASYRVAKSPRSYNSKIGVPISILQLNDDSDIGIFEVGISRFGEMEKMAPIVQCTIGIFSNLGDAHNYGFDSMHQKLKEKLKLFKYCSKIIYCADHEKVDTFFRKKYAAEQLCSWSLEGNKRATYCFSHRNSSESTIIMRRNEIEFRFSIPHFHNPYAKENLLHCIVTAYELGISYNHIQESLPFLKALSNRSEVIKGLYNNLIINDSYSFDLNALKYALENLENYADGRVKMVVLTDLYHEKDQKKYKQVLDLLSLHQIEQVYTLGPQFLKYAKVTNDGQQIFSFLNEAELIQYFKKHPPVNAIILVKGARLFQMENIVKLLFEKKHRTILEIDLTALEHNVKEFSALLHPGTQIMAVIKASAYGIGSYQIARKLERMQINYLSVAYLDEAIELRNSGISLPIMVHNPDPSSAQLMVDLNIEAEVYSISQLEQIVLGLEDKTLELGIHLKLDTGMHRLGIVEQDFDKLKSFIGSKKIKVLSVFSHLSASEDPTKDAFSSKQFELFEEMYATLVDLLGYRPWRHILNSSGIVRFPHKQYEMVRLGIGMYGVDTSGMISDRLIKVHTLKSWISQIKHLYPGETVGYGAKFTVSTPTTIATLNIGYADGYPRSLGMGNACCMVSGQIANTIGNICMDMTMIDITGLEGIYEGKEVELYGNNVDISEVAKSGNTIPYELFCNLSNRVKRVFIEY